MRSRCDKSSRAAYHALVGSAAIGQWVVSRLLGASRGTGCGGTGRGFLQAIVRAQARACAVSVMLGNSRRSSTAAENSPRCSKAARIAAASASVTAIMPAGMGVRSESSERPVPRVGWPKLAMERSRGGPLLTRGCPPALADSAIARSVG